MGKYEDSMPIGECPYCGKPLDLDDAWFCFECNNCACRECFEKYFDTENRLCPNCKDILDE